MIECKGNRIFLHSCCIPQYIRTEVAICTLEIVLFSLFNSHCIRYYRKPKCPRYITMIEARIEADSVIVSDLCQRRQSQQKDQCKKINLHSLRCVVIMATRSIFNNYSPKWRWIADTIPSLSSQSERAKKHPLSTGLGYAKYNYRICIRRDWVQVQLRKGKFIWELKQSRQRRQRGRHLKN